MKKILICLLSVSGLAACNNGSSSSSTSASAQALPASYVCTPSNLPTVNSTNGLKIAYAANCAVESASQTVNLQALSSSLLIYLNQDPDSTIYTESAFYSNCSGTPIQYNSQTGIGFIVTAAHCITANKTSTINIYDVESTTGHNMAWVYQGTSAGPLQENQTTGQIYAAYETTQYNGNVNDGYDIAVVKVKTQPGKILQVASNVRLAPSNFNLSSSTTQLMALGYGSINPTGVPPINIPNYQLYYITYQYFGTNSYGLEVTPTSLMNGWLVGNTYYSIICPGDSGGGDFAWDGNYWNLVGAHSYGSLGCGKASSIYTSDAGGAADVSADVRQFNSWIQTILTQDTQATGCANLGSQYVCKSGTGE